MLSNKVFYYKLTKNESLIARFNSNLKLSTPPNYYLTNTTQILNKMNKFKLFLVVSLVMIIFTFAYDRKVNNCRGTKMRECKELCNGFENIQSCDIVIDKLVCQCKLE